MLSSLEEIREGALSKIIVKMQCQARRVLVHVTYQGKIAEKKGISSIQRNIRLYYNCRDWVWYQFYTMIKGELGALKKRLAEEERRKLMAEGLAKFQAALADATAPVNEALHPVVLLLCLKRYKVHASFPAVVAR